jgi:ssDNA-binding Zn-finger/Zn-ribbon topoisomerase 1
MKPKPDALQAYVGRKLAYSCWVCSSQMVIRQDKETGKLFLGCNRWPDCKHTEEIPESIWMELINHDRLPGL